MPGTVGKNRKKKLKAEVSPPKQDMLTVVTVRISDEEKGRIDQIMSNRNIKRYSDVMRMAVRMLKAAAI
ncbi:MAG: hypothetical protein H7Y05_01015 [Steroidobacteraceae bacterium]|nr:hypothetical protein [Deltaproteobacteria bacterium]